VLTVLVLTVAVAISSGFVYVRREQMGLTGVGLAALRTIAACALLLLLVNPGSSARDAGGDPVVLLDQSLSMAVSGGRWEQALDTAVAIAGMRGTILRFGTTVGSFDTEPPNAGASRLTAALRSAVAMGGPVYVVTDGELDDAGIIDPEILENVSVLTFPRDTVANAALLDIDVPQRAQIEDSIRVMLTVGTWGGPLPSTANLEISVGDRRIATREVALPQAPGIARRRLTLPPALLANGTNVLRFSLATEGDLIAGDDERVRIVEVSEQPAVVVLLNPPDWEGRFLVSELREISRTTVRGYAHVTPELWIDMNSALPLPVESVRRFVRSAELLITRGDRGDVAAIGARQPVWNWPTVIDDGPEAVNREWYLSGALLASPLAGRLASVQWDSVPPVVGLTLEPSGRHDWVGLTARQGRRGAERPLLLGSDSAGVRSLITLGTGWWRWRLRGGAAREAYRATLAAGVDWLLSSDQSRRDLPLSSSSVVSRDEPVLFQWAGDSVPDSLGVTVTRDGDNEVATYSLRFDSNGAASIGLQPGAIEAGYRAAESPNP